MGTDTWFCVLSHRIAFQFATMAPAMKTMKAMKAAVKSMSKSAIADALAEKTELKRRDCIGMLQTLASIAEREVKKNGKFIIPGVAMLKTRRKPATKAGKREIFGKMQVVKAKSARTIVKAFPAAALKQAV